MSDRAYALAKALEARLGAKAGQHAAPILLELLVNGYCLVNLEEIPSSLREDGLLVTIATELEIAAQGHATYGSINHGAAAWDVAATPNAREA